MEWVYPPPPTPPTPFSPPPFLPQGLRLITPDKDDRVNLICQFIFFYSSQIFLFQSTLLTFDLSSLHQTAPERHFEIAFRLFDLNGDGDVQVDEFQQVSRFRLGYSGTEYSIFFFNFLNGITLPFSH